MRQETLKTKREKILATMEYLEQSLDSVNREITLLQLSERNSSDLEKILGLLDILIDCKAYNLSPEECGIFVEEWDEGFDLPHLRDTLQDILKDMV